MFKFVGTEHRQTHVCHSLTIIGIMPLCIGPELVLIAMHEILSDWIFRL